IANYLKDLTHFPIVDLLTRVKKTKNQAEIKEKKQRYLNIKGAFKIKKDVNINFISGSRIILVDDVVTTGYTASEAAKILKKAGAQKVYLFSLAQG
ncbi:MAG: ComF family protein, partial [Microgenomates group bacterium]